MKQEIKFIEGAIRPDEMARLIAGQSHKNGLGAHALFAGQVRADIHASGSIRYIDFSAYVPMAEKVFSDICQGADKRFQIDCLHILHSTGRVNVGEICFVTMVSTKHRQEAFEALRFVVEAVKARVPIFGKEVAENDIIKWKQNT